MGPPELVLVPLPVPHLPEPPAIWPRRDENATPNTPLSQPDLACCENPITEPTIEPCLRRRFGKRNEGGLITSDGHGRRAGGCHGGALRAHALRAHRAAMPRVGASGGTGVPGFVCKQQPTNGGFRVLASASFARGVGEAVRFVIVGGRRRECGIPEGQGGSGVHHIYRELSPRYVQICYGYVDWKTVQWNHLFHVHLFVSS